MDGRSWLMHGAKNAAGTAWFLHNVHNIGHRSPRNPFSAHRRYYLISACGTTIGSAHRRRKKIQKRRDEEKNRLTAQAVLRLD